MYQRYSARNEGQTLQHNIHMTHKLKMNFTKINETTQRLILFYHYEFFVSRNSKILYIETRDHHRYGFYIKKVFFNHFDDPNQL